VRGPSERHLAAYRSLRLYAALQRVGTPAELHIFGQGGPWSRLGAEESATPPMPGIGRRMEVSPRLDHDCRRIERSSKCDEMSPMARRASPALHPISRYRSLGNWSRRAKTFNRSKHELGLRKNRQRMGNEPLALSLVTGWFRRNSIVVFCLLI
jgi:hypothetical protein